MPRIRPHWSAMPRCSDGVKPLRRRPASSTRVRPHPLPERFRNGKRLARATWASIFCTVVRPPPATAATAREPPASGRRPRPPFGFSAPEGPELAFATSCASSCLDLRQSRGIGLVVGEGVPLRVLVEFNGPQFGIRHGLDGARRDGLRCLPSGERSEGHASCWCIPRATEHWDLNVFPGLHQNL
jgi:hypothetical protein